MGFTLHMSEIAEIGGMNLVFCYAMYDFTSDTTLKAFSIFEKKLSAKFELTSIVQASIVSREKRPFWKKLF